MKETDVKKKIRKFRRRLNMEAGILAGTIGVMAGLSGMIAMLLYGRLSHRVLLLKEAVIALLILFVISAAAAYVFRLRPKKKEVLQRIDALGLKERVITMEELKQEETVIAQKQRQDAKKHLAELDVESMKPRLYIKPLLCCVVLAVTVIVLLVLPFPEKEVDELAEQNALEMELVDELVAALKKLVEASEITGEHKAELNEIVEALSVSFTPEDSTLTRTAKIATASKRLDMYEASEQGEVTVLKQQSGDSETVQEAQAEQTRLSQTIKNMKDIMGTSIDVLNKVEGTFWTPEGPTAGTTYDVEPLPTEEETDTGENPTEGEEPAEGEEPPEGMEPGEGGEPPEGEEGDQNGAGGQTIFDPEQGEVSYGSVYEEYYKEILKALTEREFSEEIREIIENYSNSLE